MCFETQPRALFSTSDLQKVVRTGCLCNIFTSKSVSSHNGMQFFGALASLLFDPPELENSKQTKHHGSRLLCLFARFDLRSSDSFYSNSFSCLPPHTTVAASVHQSEAWLLDFHVAIYIYLHIIHSHAPGMLHVKGCLYIRPCPRGNDDSSLFLIFIGTTSGQ